MRWPAASSAHSLRSWRRSMSRLVLTLALAFVATACAPATESRTVIAAGPRVRFEVTARLRKGTREGAFGLMFASRGGGDNRTFATFGLTANGTYRVASWIGGKWNYPVPPTATRSVKTEYGAPNTVAVELRDRSIVAYVNGRPVATAELAAEASGTLGLYVDQRGMEVLFTNLRVSELPPIR